MGAPRLDSRHGGAGEHLRLSMAHLPLGHAHAGALPRGWLEVSVQEAFRRLLGPGDVLYDIGANIGFFSLVGAGFVEPGGRVYAFDPVPENADAVRANAALNRIDNVTVLERAVGAARGRDRLLRVEDLSWSQLESQGWHPRTVDAVEVEVVPIDELVASGELSPPTLVKIDVEARRARRGARDGGHARAPPPGDRAAGAADPRVVPLYFWRSSRTICSNRHR